MTPPHRDVPFIWELYSRDARAAVELVEFTDGAFDVLFDLVAERTVLVHGLSRYTSPNSRDVSYHRGFPSVAGYEKGHAMSHSQGGLEGGPNYFAQVPWVNRRLSPVGRLWRDIEDYLARNPGVFSVVRFIYCRRLLWRRMTGRRSAASHASRGPATIRGRR
jgi:hypothetical protein